MGISISSSGQITQTSTPGVSGAGADAEQRANFDRLNPGAATSRVTPSMTLNDARSQADQAFSGLVSPMSLADIRAREQQQKDTSKAAAEAQFNPQIGQEQKTGMATVSTAQGVTGQNQGFNISTAEAAYLAGTQQEVNTRVKYVEDQKAAAINTGNLAAIQRADDQLNKLNEYNNQLTIAKANYALQLMSGNREQAQLELAQQQQVFNQNMANKTLDVQIAEMMGVTNDGTPTFAAKQATIQNALTEAGLTGTYNGQETLAARTAKASQLLAERGMVINEKQLAETIRANKAQEGLAGARLAADKKATDKTPSGLATAAATRLNALKQNGGFNDLTYQAELIDLAASMGYKGDGSEADKAILSNTGSALNNALNQAGGGTASGSTSNVSPVITAQTENSIMDEYSKILSFNTKGRTPDSMDKSIAMDQLVKSGKYSSKDVSYAVGGIGDKISTFFGLK